MEEELLATVRTDFVRDQSNESRPNNNNHTTTSSTNEWIWLRSLCVHTSFRQQGYARYLLHCTMMALQNHYQDAPHAPQVYCFANADLGSSLYLPLGFRRVDLADAAATLHLKHPPISLQQQYKTVARRLSQRSGESNPWVDLECYVYHIPDETTIENHRISSSASVVSPVNVLILQHEKETSRKTGTAQLLLEHARHTKEHENTTEVIRGLNVTKVTWSGRIDTPKVERLLQANRHQQQQQQQNREQNNNMILLWTDGTADLSLVLREASNGDGDEKNGRSKADEATRTTVESSSVTFIVIDATWQEAKTMFRKIPALWNLRRLSIRPTQASRYRLRQDYGWKKKFALCSSGNKNADCRSPANDNEDHTEHALLCTAEVVAELLQQTGNIEGAAAVRRRLESFMTKLRPLAIPDGNVE